MTHKPELDIEPAVARWFTDRFGEGAVETQAYLPGVRWFCDIVVELGFATLFVEVESRASEIRPGLAQAAGYAGTRSDGVGLVVTPPGHVDEERRVVFERAFNVPIREFDTAREQFVHDHE